MERVKTSYVGLRHHLSNCKSYIDLNIFISFLVGTCAEVARRQRDRKRGLRKWLWSCIGMSIVTGASVIAYSYVPQHQSLENVVSDTQPDAGVIVL